MYGQETYLEDCEHLLFDDIGTDKTTYLEILELGIKFSNKGDYEMANLSCLQRACW